MVCRANERGGVRGGLRVKGRNPGWCGPQPGTGEDTGRGGEGAARPLMLKPWGAAPPSSGHSRGEESRRRTSPRRRLAASDAFDLQVFADAKILIGCGRKHSNRRNASMTFVMPKTMTQLPNMLEMWDAKSRSRTLKPNEFSHHTCGTRSIQ